MKHAEIERFIPEIFARTLHAGNPLTALLEVIEILHEPVERILEVLDAHFSPYRTPDTFVPFLSKWVDLDWLFETPKRTVRSKELQKRGEDDESVATIPTGLGRLRELTAAAAYLSQWRGTVKGLVLFCEIAVGLRGFTIKEQIFDSSGHIRPFHIQVQAPYEALPYRALLERIIEREKPAYVTFELDFSERKIKS